MTKPRKPGGKKRKAREPMWTLVRSWDRWALIDESQHSPVLWVKGSVNRVIRKSYPKGDIIRVHLTEVKHAQR